MARTTLINKFGKVAGWNDVTVNVLGRDLEGVTSLSYDDEQSWENSYGAGKFPIGEEEGNYEASASMTLFSEELIGLQASLVAGGRIQDIPAFDIVVQYEYGAKLYKDVIRNCRFKNNGRELSQGDGKILKEIELKCSHIDWNV